MALINPWQNILAQKVASQIVPQTGGGGSWGGTPATVAVPQVTPKPVVTSTKPTTVATKTVVPTSTQNRSLAGTLTQQAPVQQTTTPVSTARTLEAPRQAGQDTSFANLRALLAQTARFTAAAGPSPEDYLSMYAKAGIPLSSPQAIQSALQRGTISRAGMVGDVYKSALDVINEQEQRQSEYTQTVMQSLPKSILAQMTGKEFDEIKSGNISPELRQKIAEATALEQGQAEGFTLSPGQTRYSASGEVLATAPESKETSQGKIVKVNGVDYVQNIDGSFSTPQVPELKQQASELKQNALTTAQQLLEKFDTRKGTQIVGASRLLTGGRAIPGTASADFEALYNNVLSNLSLDNVKLLKGQGQVSDAERKLLADASSKLKLTQSEPEFRSTLVNMIGTLKGYDTLGITDKTYDEAVKEYGQEKVDSLIEANKPTTEIKNVLSLGPITGFGSEYWAPGLDIDLKIGDPVPSPVAGVVEFVGSNGGFGNQVRITTSTGSSVWLSHLSKSTVNVGDEINYGDIIGLGGNTGNVIPVGGGDGSHLDLTVVRKDGTYVDPRDIYNSLMS